MYSFSGREHQERLARIRGAGVPPNEANRPLQHIIGNSGQVTHEPYWEGQEQFQNSLSFDIQGMPNNNYMDPNMSSNHPRNHQFSHAANLTTTRDQSQRNHPMAPHHYTAMMGVLPGQTALFDASGSDYHASYSRTERENFFAHSNTLGMNGENFIDPSLNSVEQPNVVSENHPVQEWNHVREPAVAVTSSVTPSSSPIQAQENAVQSAPEVQAHIELLQSMGFGAAMTNIHPGALFGVPPAVQSHTQSQGLQVQRPEILGSRPFSLATSQQNQQQVAPVTIAGPPTGPAAPRYTYTKEAFAGCRKGLFAKGMGAKEDGSWSMETLVNHLHSFLKFHGRPDFKVYVQGKGSDLSQFKQRKGAVEALSQPDRTLLDEFIRAHDNLKKAESGAVTPAAAVARPNRVQTGKSRAPRSNKRRRNNEEEEDESPEDGHVVVSDGSVPETARPAKRTRQGPPVAGTPRNRSNAGPSGSTGNTLAVFPDFEALDRYLASIESPGIMAIVNNHLVSNGCAAVRIIRNPGTAAPGSTSNNPSPQKSRNPSMAAFQVSPNASREHSRNMSTYGQPIPGGASQPTSSVLGKRKVNVDIGIGASQMLSSSAQSPYLNGSRMIAKPSLTSQKQKGSEQRLHAPKPMYPVAPQALSGDGHPQLSGFKPSLILQAPPNIVEPNYIGSSGYQTQGHTGAEMNNGSFYTSTFGAPVGFSTSHDFYSVPDNADGKNSSNQFPPSTPTRNGSQPLTEARSNQVDFARSLGIPDFSDFDLDSFNGADGPPLTADYFEEFVAATEGNSENQDSVSQGQGL